MRLSYNVCGGHLNFLNCLLFVPFKPAHTVSLRWFTCSGTNFGTTCSVKDGVLCSTILHSISLPGICFYAFNYFHLINSLMVICGRWTGTPRACWRVAIKTFLGFSILFHRDLCVFALVTELSRSFDGSRERTPQYKLYTAIRLSIAVSLSGRSSVWVWKRPPTNQTHPVIKRRSFFYWLR